MIEREFEAAEGAETVGFSHGDFSFVVQTLDDFASLGGRLTLWRTTFWATFITPLCTKTVDESFERLNQAAVEEAAAHAEIQKEETITKASPGPSGPRTV